MIKPRKIPVKISRRTVILLSLGLAAVVAAGLAGRGAGNKATQAAGGPDSRTQPLLDGCVRDRGAILTKQVPNWVYVGGGIAQNQLVNGGGRLAIRARTSGRCRRERMIPSRTLPTTSPSTSSPIRSTRISSGTGNFEGQSSETARLHTERESLSFPVWAWPDRDDRIAMVGSWVWDCDHTTAAGEHTEIHPFRVLWVERNPGGPSRNSPAGDREADLFSTNRRHAGGRPGDLRPPDEGRSRGVQAMRRDAAHAPFARAGRTRSC